LQKHNPEVANEISCYVPYYFDLGKMWSRSHNVWKCMLGFWGKRITKRLSKKKGFE
jgi:hypothetical protein